MNPATAPPITRILETALYVDDMDRAVAFYRDVMGLAVLDAGPRLVAMDGGQATLLLLFKRGATRDGVRTPSGDIPPHDGVGPAHVAFAVAASDLAAWDRHLEAHRIAIESRITWARGGTSLYFRDPDGHSIELASPGLWATY